MSHSYALPKARKGNRVKEVLHVREAIQNALARLAGSEEHQQLRQLWQHWAMVMGDDLCEMALPLGHRKSILLVGAEDHLALQELSFYTAEILDRVNAFMDAPFFEKVELHLLLGRESLKTASVLPVTQSPLGAPAPMQRPPGLDGSFAATPGLDPESPVVKCYEAYLRLHNLA